MMNNLCIYHGNCADGFSAATIVNLAFNKKITFHPGIYQDPPPDITDKDVIIVDFSYKRPILLEMAKQARNILILDHHKTAEKDLIDLPSNVTTIFNMEKCGAMLAWEHFFSDRDPPPVLLHIQDYDLWRFELPNTREIAAAIYSYPYEFSTWKKLLFKEPDVLFVEGSIIRRNTLKNVRDFIAVAMYETEIAGYRVPIINAPFQWNSTIGDMLKEGEPFVATYYDTAKGRVYGLRSAKDGVDVSEIAAKFGGGGHKHAAGFRISENDPKSGVE